jgi:3-methyladenine DNA glycosylase AlkD
MEDWAADFDSWGVYDGCCMNLFDRTEFAYPKAVEWSHKPEEFVKRAAFALTAFLSVHDKKMDDKPFLDFLPILAREATDPRTLVKKAVNWAMRQIRKKNVVLNLAAVRMAEKIKQAGSSGGRWIASDALRELTSDKVRARLGVDGERP